MASTSDTDDRWLIASVGDAAALSVKTGEPRFVGFLDARQGVVARAAVPRDRVDDVWLYGGYPAAERCLLGVFPPKEEPTAERFPLTALTVRYRTAAAVTHRDVLGSLMALGLQRHAVGDILCEAGRTVVFVSQTVAPFVLQQLTRVGGEGVRVQEGVEEPLPVSDAFEELRGTVASPRLDAMVRLAVGCSREEAVRRIAAGTVAVDHLPCTAPAHTVDEGALLSVRGAGRFRVEQVGPLTRKGRWTVILKKYTG